MKLPNGYGSVYKLSGKRRKPWAAVATHGWTEGKQNRIIIGYFEDRASALKALGGLTGKITPKINITLKQLYEEWLQRREAMFNNEKLSKQALDCNKASWLKFKEIENIKVKDIRTGQLQKVLDNCAQSKSSLQKIVSLASMLWEYAQENDIVEKNYADFLTIPQREEKEKKGFTTLQLSTLEKAAKNKVEWADTILILCYTGFRINELLNLTPFNVTYQKRKIVGLTGGLKTAAGKDRYVPVHPKIEPYLRCWLNKKGNYIICNTKSGKMSDSNYRERYYYPTLEALGLPKLSPHACRHTFASLCEKAGLSQKKIEQLMGHTNYRMSKKYTHVEIEELSAAVAKL